MKDNAGIIGWMHFNILSVIIQMFVSSFPFVPGNRKWTTTSVRRLTQAGGNRVLLTDGLSDHIRLVLEGLAGEVH